MGFGDFLKGIVAQVNPFDGGKTYGTYNRKRRDEDQYSAPQPQVRNTPSTRQFDNPISDIVRKKPTNIGLEPNNQVNVPQKSEYDNQLLPPPKQSFWNKVRDQFDANTEADQYRRLKGNITKGENKPIVLENPGNIISKTPIVGHAVKATNTLLNQTREIDDTIKQAVAVQTGNTEAYRNASSRLDDIKRGYQKNSGGLFNVGTLYDEEASKRGDFKTGMKDIVAPTATAMLDVYTLGKGNLIDDAIREAGLRKGLRIATPDIVKSSAGNFASGVTDTYSQGGDVKDMLRAGGINAVLGVAPDVALPALAKGVKGNLAKVLRNKPLDVTDVVDELDDAAISTGAETAIQALEPRRIPIREVTDVPITQVVGEDIPINVRDLSEPKPVIREVEGDAAKRARDVYDRTGVAISRTGEPYKSISGEMLANKEVYDPISGNWLTVDGVGSLSDMNKRIANDNETNILSALIKKYEPQRVEGKSLGEIFSPEDKQLTDLFNQAHAEGKAPSTPPKIKVPEDIPVVDKTEVPQGLPEQPGTVRAMAQTDKQATKTQIAAEQPPVVPPNSIPKETGTPIAQEGRTTVERFANQIDDASTREVVNDALDELNKTLKKNKVNIEETTERAVKTVNNETLEESLRNAGKTISGDGSGLDPQQITDELMRAKKLLAMEQTPEVQKAVSESINALQDAGSKHGTGLVMFRHLFDSLPPEMKSQYLVERVGKQLRQLGVEMQPSVRAEVLRRIDNITDMEKSLDEVATALRANSEKIKLTGQGDLTRAEVDKLNKLYNDLTIEKEVANERALEYSAQVVREHSAGKVDKVIQASKTSMLSNPFGAIRDIVVTPLTSIADITTNAVQGVGGRALNKLPGQAGKFREFHLSDLSELAKGNVQGVKDTARAFTKDERRLDDFVKEYQRATRTDSKAGLRTRVGRFIGDTREAATNITRGQKDMMNTQLVRQQGQKLGLKGKSLDDFVNTTKMISDAKTQDQATQFWLRSNNLHRNDLSETLGRVSKGLEDKGPIGKLASHIMAPFKSWQAGNFDRLFTDKNMIHNIYKIGDGIAKKDPQMVVDNLSRLGTNTGEAFVGGMLLHKMGVLSDTNTNGEDYNGPYINVGGRSISLSTLGPGAMNMAVGYNLQKLFNGEHSSLGEFSNSLIKQVKGIAGTNQTLGGENAIQTALGSGQYGQDENSLIARSLGSAGRMFVPASGAMNATNSMLNMNTTLNPTGERAKTKATKEVVGDDGKVSEKTDALRTEVNKLKNTIPFLSQALPREEGKTFKDPLDIVTAGSHANDSSTKARADEQVAQDTKDAKNTRDKQYRESKTPESTDGIRKAFEDGDIDRAIRGEEWAMARANDDGELSKKTRAEYDERINRLKTAKDNNLSVEDVDEYEHTTLSEWRAMADDNPELYQKLWAIDEAMAKAGASFAKGDNKKQKYSAKKSGSGRGRGGSKINKLSADFGRLTGVGSNAPKVREYQTMAESTKILPRIKRIQPNIVHTIRSGRV